MAGILGTVRQGLDAYGRRQFTEANQSTAGAGGGLTRAAFRPGFSSINQANISTGSPMANMPAQQGTGGGGAVPWDGEYDNGMGGIFGEAEQEGRGLQLDALGLARGAALGNAPSRAEILGQQGLDQAAREQASIAASARGPAALAMAQQQQGYNTAAIQQQGAAQMAAVRADEMARARDSYLGGAGQVRGADAARYGQELGRGTAQAGFEMDAERNRTQRDIANADIGMRMAGAGYDYAGRRQQGQAAYADRAQGADESARGQAAAQSAADRDKMAGLARGIASAAPGLLNAAVGALGGGPAAGAAAGGATTGQSGVNATSSAKMGEKASESAQSGYSSVPTSTGRSSF